ncbi:MAG: alkaline phosphatase family protein [Proteobacteria bacterium]|nr:alkaline phosphatase family protein [Pseudomonadota bacterium]
MIQKVLVIGLDCGSFRFIKPYAKEGALPNLKRVMRTGVARTLKSTVPPVSPPAWATFLTGKNPGQHGIFQFVEMNVKNYNFTSNLLINSGLFSGSTFIDYISDSNLKVGVIKVPFTYPPWKVNGFMVSGEPSPDWKKAHTYPPELSDKIGKVNLGSSADFMRYNVDELFRHLKFDCDIRTKIAVDMLEKDSYDFFMLVHTITDAASHRFWKYTDPTCPNYKNSFEKYQNIIKDIYIESDKSIGKILEGIDKDTTVFFMSDHGSDRKPIHIFHINSWLKQMGYLQCHNNFSLSKPIWLVLSKIKDLLPAVLRHLIVFTLQSKFQKKLNALKTKVADFNWENTKAYAVNLYTTYEGIALNLKGRQPNGIINPGAEAEQLCKEIKAALLDIKDPRNNNKVVEKVYHREEVFNGPFAEKMPELIVQLNHNYKSGNIFNEQMFTDVPASDFDFQSGDHDENGIFIAFGNNIKKNVELLPAQIQDVAPTILYTMGLPIPDDMDGQVLLDIFEQKFLDKNPVKRVNGKKPIKSSMFKLSEEDEDEMKEQLKGLGYI